MTAEMLRALLAMSLTPAQQDEIIRAHLDAMGEQTAGEDIDARLESVGLRGKGETTETVKRIGQLIK